MKCGTIKLKNWAVVVYFVLSVSLKKKVLFRRIMDEAGHGLQFLFIKGCCFYIQYSYNKPHMKNTSASSAKLLYKTLYILLQVLPYKRITF